MKQTYWLFLFLLCSCTVHKVKKSVYDSEVFEKGHMGFMLYDPAKEKTLVSLNEKKYFIPASNTKIFTFYTSYKILGDGQVNGLNYIQKNDSLIFWGTGDPSLLHPDLKDTTTLVFLKKRPENLFMVDNFDLVSGYGPGWSWNWYPYYFAAERSSMPVYGNVLRYAKEAASPLANVYPNSTFLPLSKQVGNAPERYEIRRDFEKNIFSSKYVYPPVCGKIAG